MKIFLATNNDHKKEEFQKIFNEHTLLTPKDIGLDFECEETGKNYAENAYLKAKTLYDMVKAPVLADDSGLSVSALDGAPGLYSARYGSTADKKISDEDRCVLILDNLKDKKDRSAFYVCNLTFIAKEFSVFSVQETFEGLISKDMRGENGFGYDPIFFLPEYNKNVAELSSEIKNSISHRAKAAKRMKLILEDIYEN